MNFGNAIIKAQCNKIKIQSFEEINKIVNTSADLIRVNKILSKCDDKILSLHKQSVPGHIETLSEKFIDIAYSSINDPSVRGESLNQLNHLCKNKRSKIILKFINNNK